MSTPPPCADPTCVALARHGSVWCPIHATKSCWKCYGRGFQRDNRTDIGAGIVFVHCDRCNGTGRFPRTGRFPKETTP